MLKKEGKEIRPLYKKVEPLPIIDDLTLYLTLIPNGMLEQLFEFSVNSVCSVGMVLHDINVCSLFVDVLCSCI